MRIVVAALLLVGCKAEHDWARAGLGGEASQSAPVAVARFATPPIIDGKLDDEVWKSAPLLGPFVDPRDGRALPDKPATGWARIGWDDQRLYLAFVVRDAKPDSPYKRDDADPHIWGAASGVEIMLQPGNFDDNREYYEIQTDIAGAVFDTRWDDYMQPLVRNGTNTTFGHMDWSANLERAATKLSGFYTVEVALPWSALVAGRAPIPPRPGDVWRMNLYAFRDGQRLATSWSPIRGAGNFHKSSKFGRIKF
jgi:hypothetical protein